MNWLSILFIYVLNIQSERGLLKVQRVFFIKNNFWSGDQKQLKTDKGYLFRVSVDLEDKNEFNTIFFFYDKTCYPLQSTKSGYIVLKSTMMEKNINHFLNSPEDDKVLWRFHYLFVDKQIFPRYSVKYEGIKQDYVVYKLPEKISENSILLRSVVTRDICMNNIKKKLEGFARMKLLRFNEYFENFDENNEKEKKLNNTESWSNFNLCYFKNHSECIDNLKIFINNLCYFKLLNDDVSETNVVESFEITFDTTTTIGISQFRKCLYEKFNENLRKINNNKIDENKESIFVRCFNYIKNEMLRNNIFLAIGGRYNIDFYIEKISNFIYESVVQKLMKYPNSISDDKILIFCRMITNSLKRSLENLQYNVVRDLCEFNIVHKHFFELFGSKIETLDDFINVEKMMCDYHSMFVYIFNLYQKFHNNSRDLNHFLPSILVDNCYNLIIVDGIEINLNSSTEVDQIKGIDNKGEEIIMVKDTDYFSDQFCMLYFPSEVLKIRNIHEIEVISFDGRKKYDKIKVNEYLSA